MSKDREEWTTYQFSEVCIVNPSYKLERNKEYSYVEMAAVSESSAQLKYVQKKKYTAQSGSKFKNGDVLFARITPCTQNGKTAHVTNLETEYGFGSTEFIVLSPKEEILLDKYLYYFVKDNKVRNKAIARMVGTTGRQRVPNEFFKEELEIELPSIQEQQKIAEILSSVDETIEKTEAVIEQTEKVKKGLMQQLFTKGIGHTKFKKTEIGEIPEEWDVLALNDVLDFVGSGITPKGGSAVYQSEGIPFIRSQNVYPDGLRLDDIAFISDAIHEKMNRSKVQVHDVLLNITGASIGRCTYVPKGFGEANVNQHVCILRSNEKIYYKYLAYFMNSSLGQRQIFSEQAGQTREGLNYQQIRAFSITVPSMIEQEKIANIINTFNQKVNNERKKLDTLQYLKKGLVQSLFTGKVRVKVDEVGVTQV